MRPNVKKDNCYQKMGLKDIFILINRDEVLMVLSHYNSFLESKKLLNNYQLIAAKIH